MVAPEPQGSASLTLLIDLDGTLVDTVADLTVALNRLLTDEGHDPLPESTVRKLVGRGAPKLVERSFDSLGVEIAPQRLQPLVKRFLEVYEAAPAAHSRPYHGVEDTLLSWRRDGHTLAVCTNKPQTSSEIILREMGLADHFAAVGGGDRFSVRKPHGGHLHETVALAGGSIERAVMIGDSATDLEAARHAGVPVVLVDYGYSNAPVRSLGADAVVSEFASIPGILPRLMHAPARR